MKSFIIILLLCVFGGSKLFAQKTEFIASAPSVVEVGEQFRLSFVLNAKGENLQVPTIKGFDLLAGPSLSTSSNITIINGDMKQNQEYTYTYILEGQEEDAKYYRKLSQETGELYHVDTSLSICICKSICNCSKPDSFPKAALSRYV